MIKILIMGLPGAGKTTLSIELIGLLKMNRLSVGYLCADNVRAEANDWDFTTEGRLRQARRMHAKVSELLGDVVIIDALAALPESRAAIDADILVWMDTTKTGRYADTLAGFIPPETCNILVTEQNAKKWGPILAARILMLQKMATAQSLPCGRNTVNVGHKKSKKDSQTRTHDMAIITTSGGIPIQLKTKFERSTFATAHSKRLV